MFRKQRTKHCPPPEKMTQINCLKDYLDFVLAFCLGVRCNPVNAPYLERKKNFKIYDHQKKKLCCIVVMVAYTHNFMCIHIYSVKGLYECTLKKKIHFLAFFFVCPQFCHMSKIPNWYTECNFDWLNGVGREHICPQQHINMPKTFTTFLS